MSDFGRLQNDPGPEPAPDELLDPTELDLVAHLSRERDEERWRIPRRRRRLMIGGGIAVILAAGYLVL